MTRTRTLTALLTAALLLGPTLMTTAQASTWRADECRYRGANGRMDWSTWEVKQTIRCAAPKFGVSAWTALQIAYRESRYRASARNVSSGACGLFQFYPAGSFPIRLGRVPNSYGPFQGSCYSARDNVFAAMREVQLYGWQAWGL